MDLIHVPVAIEVAFANLWVTAIGLALGADCEVDLLIAHFGLELPLGTVYFAIEIEVASSEQNNIVEAAQVLGVAPSPSVVAAA